MSDLFYRSIADKQVGQTSTNQTPELPHGRRKKRLCIKRAVFRIVNILEVILHITAYGGIFWMTLVAFIAVAVSFTLTSPVWIPCSIFCLPIAIVITLLCKFTTIPIRSANSVRESSLVKKISWNSIFGLAKTQVSFLSKD